MARETYRRVGAYLLLHGLRETDSSIESFRVELQKHDQITVY